MSYKQLLKDAWNTTWKNKWLWLIAFFAGVPVLQINTIEILGLFRLVNHSQILRTSKGIQAELFSLVIFGGLPIFYLFHKFMLVLVIDKTLEGENPEYGKLWGDTWKKLLTVVLFAGITVGLLIVYFSVSDYVRTPGVAFFLYNLAACFVFFLLSQVVYVMLIEHVGVVKAVITTWKCVFAQNFKEYLLLSIILSGIATTFLSLSTHLNLLLDEFGESWMLFVPYENGKQSPFIVDFLLLLSVIFIYLVTSILLTWVTAVWIHTYKKLRKDKQPKV
jgi:hypothetical protein